MCMWAGMGEVEGSEGSREEAEDFWLSMDKLLTWRYWWRRDSAAPDGGRACSWSGSRKPP